MPSSLKKALLADLAAKSVDPSRLDELVIEHCMQDGAAAANETPENTAQESALATASDVASSINNAGLAEQVNFLFDYLGAKEADLAIRKASGL